MDILFEIVENTKKKIRQRKEQVTIEALEKKPCFSLPRISLREALQKRKAAIITEIKFRSPSKGEIHSLLSPEEIALGYQQAGAVALSVLTEEDYFAGKNDYLERARKVTEIPILRKDFIVDEYQILEARAIGADAILLIAASLSPQEIQKFTAFAHSLDLEVLLEVHSIEELKNSWIENIDVLGVNNRNLKSLQVSIETSFEMIEKIPPQTTKISESGLSDPKIIQQLIMAGFDGFLIGETFMQTENPPLAFQNLLAQLENFC